MKKLLLLKMSLVMALVGGVNYDAWADAITISEIYDFESLAKAGYTTIATNGSWNSQTRVLYVTAFNNSEGKTGKVVNKRLAIRTIRSGTSNAWVFETGSSNGLRDYYGNSETGHQVVVCNLKANDAVEINYTGDTNGLSVTNAVNSLSEDVTTISSSSNATTIYAKADGDIVFTNATTNSYHRIQKIVVKPQRTTETYDFASLGNTYANSTMSDGFKWFTFGDAVSVTDATTSSAVSGLYRILNVGNADKTKIGRYFNGRIAIQHNSGNSGSPWLRNNGNGLQSNGAGLKGYVAIMELKAGDDFTITGSSWYVRSGNVSATSGGETVETLTSGMTYYALDANPILLYYDNYPRIQKVVVHATNDIITEPTVTATRVNGTHRDVLVSEPISVSDYEIKKDFLYSFTSAAAAKTGTEVTSDVIDVAESIYVYCNSAGCETTAEYTSPGEVTLNSPVFSVNSFGSCGDYKVATFAIANADNSNLELSPEATLTLSLRATDGTVTSPTLAEGIYIPTAKGTLTVTSSCDGYTSKSIDIVLGRFYSAATTYPDFSTLTGAEMHSEFINGADPFNATETSTWGNWSDGTYKYWQSTNTGNHYVYDNLRSAGINLKLLSGYGLGNGGSAIDVWFNARVYTTGQLVDYTVFNGSTTSDIAYYYNRNNSLYYKIPANNVLKTIVIYNPVENPTVSKTISAAGWATYCSPYALDFSDNIENLTDAYIVTGGANGVLTKSSVKGGTVPANTGLLLKGTEGTVTIPVVASSTTDVSSNIMIGVTANTDIAAGTGWVLMNDATNGLGFYKNINAFTVGANTAYIPLSKLPEPTNNARGFFSLFEDETTGVQELKNSRIEELKNYYDLQGRRVAQPTKGLYIKNGCKIVIK